MPVASARAIYRRLCAAELADWSRSLAWRLPLAGSAGLGAAILTGPLPSVARLTASLAVIGSVGWRLRFRASHDLGMPGSRANIDHLLLGPSGVFVIDSKQYTGRIQQTPDGHLWHNHYPWMSSSRPSAPRPARSRRSSVRR